MQKYLLQMAQGNFALFCTHAANMGGHFQHLVLILLVRYPLFEKCIWSTAYSYFCM